MNDVVTRFRTRYRAGIPRWYHAGVHGGFVLAWGLGVIATVFATNGWPAAWAWLAAVPALLLFNIGEYTVHRELGHVKRPWARLFYQRHSGDHHSFFVPGRLHFEQARDWRVIFFPPWLVVVYSLLVVGPAYWLLSRWQTDVAAVSAATLMAGYLSYEAVHAVSHLPDSHWLTRVPGLAAMRRHHALHHDPAHMTRRHFNIVFPFTDWLRRT